MNSYSAHQMAVPVSRFSLISIAFYEILHARFLELFNVVCVLLCQLLVEDEKAKMAVLPDVMVSRTTTRPAPSSAALAIVVASQRRQSAMKVCIMLVSLVLMMAVILVGIMVYKHLMSSAMVFKVKVV